MNPLAKVVALADSFCELTMEHPGFPRKKSPHEAIHYIEKILGQPYNKDAFKALKYLLEREEKEAS